MKKIIFSFAVITLVLSGCNTVKNEVETKNISENYESNFLKSYHSVESKYKSTKSFNQCLTENISYCNQRVIEQKALETEDVLICNDLKDISLIEQCKSAIMSFKARNENNLSWCEQVSGIEQVNCKYSIISEEAINKSDVDLCDKIQAVWNVPEEVEKFHKDAQINCKQNVYTSIAAEKLDTLICNKIWEKEVKQSCIDQVNTFKNLNENTETQWNNSAE